MNKQIWTFKIRWTSESVSNTVTSGVFLFLLNSHCMMEEFRLKFNHISKDSSFIHASGSLLSSGNLLGEKKMVGTMSRVFCQFVILSATHDQVNTVMTSIISLNFPGRKSNVHFVRSKYAMGTQFCSYAKINKWWK